MKLRHYIALFCTGIIIGNLYLIFSHRNMNTEKTSLVVGMMSGYVPFLVVNENGTFEGYESDLAHALAEKMHKKLIIKDMNFSALLHALDNEEIDIIISDIAVTKEREEDIAFVQYREDQKQKFEIVFWQNQPTISIKTLDDLKRVGPITICVEKDSIIEKCITQYPFITPLAVEHYVDALIALKEGTAQAAILMEEISTQYKKQIPDLTSTHIYLNNLAILGVGIGIKKTNFMVIERVQEAIQSLKDDGRLMAIAKKWQIQ